MSYDHKDLVQYESRAILEGAGFKKISGGLYERKPMQETKKVEPKKKSFIKRILGSFFKNEGAE